MLNLNRLIKSQLNSDHFMITINITRMWNVIKIINTFSNYVYVLLVHYTTTQSLGILKKGINYYIQGLVV